ncbi:MAG: hypothetical protein QOI80_291, partial [Solirubrobacteraceae bacterium]|nr:hypothetical protein [Solirubrobacteraceae bacterium]
MAEVVEVKVPDIGDFTDVPVIEILVEPGQAVDAEAPLVVLESDKATMEVPSPQSGVVKEIKVAIGDTVSEGSVVLTMEGQAVPEPPPSDGDAPAAAASPTDQGARPPDPPAPAGSAASGPLPPSDDIYASPAVRRQARAKGVDLYTISGSGRGGRITLEDLDK